MADQTPLPGTSRPRDLLATLRPQVYIKGSPEKVKDPIVEPLWVGVRALAAVDADGASLVDSDGEPVPNVETIAEGLADAIRVDAMVVDGFVTKQGGTSGHGVFLMAEELPSMGTMLGLRRNRAIDTLKLKEEALHDVAFDPADEVRLIVTDLLWLDDTSLLEIPLLERRRLLDSVLVENDVVRVGAYVRPPINTWVGSWRTQGFEGVTFRAANSPYRPGERHPDWVVSGMPRR